jgi:hypothetical protein
MDKANSETSKDVGQGSETVNVGAISLTWDSQNRLAELRFSEPTVGTGPAAEVLVQAMTRWVGTESRPFGLLADTKNNPSVDAQWRAKWGEFYKLHKTSGVMAVFNMSAILRVAADLFRLAIGVNLKGFNHEKDARAWMQSQGIRA